MSQNEIAVGDYVHDREADNDDLAVVTRLPEVTCNDWEIEGLNQTVADCNPEYDPNASVAIVAFESALNTIIDDWKEIDPGSFHEIVSLSDVSLYAYPLPRLTYHSKALVDTVKTWFDGACEPKNPGGHGTYGIVIKHENETIHEESGYLGSGDKMTNNVAEYEALIATLKYIHKEHPNARTIVHGDSELVIKQMTGDYAVNSNRLQPLYEQAASIALDLNVEFQWVPRHENERADILANKAYEEEVLSDEIEQRRHRALEEEMSVESLGEGQFMVKDQYQVDLPRRTCTCPDFDNRGITCKHIFKVESVVYEGK